MTYFQNISYYQFTENTNKKGENHLIFTFPKHVSICFIFLLWFVQFIHHEQEANPDRNQNHLNFHSRNAH